MSNWVDKLREFLKDHSLAKRQLRPLPLVVPDRITEEDMEAFLSEIRGIGEAADE